MNDKHQDEYKTAKAEVSEPSIGNSGIASCIPTTPAMRRLATFVHNEFIVNAQHRRQSGVDTMLSYAARAKAMKYDATQLDVLAKSGIDSRNYRPLTAMKIRSARAMLNDIIKQSGDKPYTLSPTPKPDIPKSAQKKIMEEMAREIVGFFRKIGGPLQDENQLAAFYISVMQRVGEMYDDVRRKELEWATERCNRMDQKIHDQLVQGGFIEEFNRLVNYICVYGTGLMVGPCPRVVARCRCKESDTAAGEVLKYEQDYEVIPVYEAVSPWDCYPAPNAKRVEDGSLCIKVRYTANVLWRYAESMQDKSGSPDGWFPETVKALLTQYPNGGCRVEAMASDLIRREVERDSIATENDCTLEGIRCFSSVRGGDLIKFGIFKTPAGDRIFAHNYYKTETIVIADYVVYCRVIDDRMMLPVAKACLYESPDSWWGDTIADLLYTAQSMQNNALKNLIINSGLSSNGLFYCTDVNNVVSLDGTPALSIRSGKMFGFRTSNIAMRSGAPIGTLNIPDTTAKQLEIMKAAMSMADDDCGIPQYSVGSSSTLGSGAGRTASGLAMMQEATCRVINMCVCDLGIHVIVPVVKNTHVYNLLYDDDMLIKGDVDVNPSGLIGKILREAESQRRIQMATALGQHPVYSKALTVEAFFELIRPEIESLGVNPDKIIPSKERMAMYQMIIDAAQAQAAAQQQAAAAEPTPEQANLERVEGQPQNVALEQGGGAPAPGSVAERRNVA